MMKCAAYTDQVTAKSVTWIGVRNNNHKSLQDAHASFLLGCARAHLESMGARAGATSVAPVTCGAGYANPVRAATIVRLASPSGSNKSCLPQGHTMTAQVLTFPEHRKGTLDALSLIQQYWLILQCDDPAERVALATCWRTQLNDYVKQQPELFEHVPLHPELKLVLQDMQI